MRIAIISDIHEDFQMLEKAMAVLKYTGYDSLVCLGDITGFAPKYHSHTPDANACIDLIRSEANIVLAGNHDHFTSQRLPSYHLEMNIPSNWYELSKKDRFELSGNSLWLYEEELAPELSFENELFLASLNEWCIYEIGQKKILFSHFLKPDLSGVGTWFPYRVGELRPHFKFMEEHNSTLAFVGHCHVEAATRVSKLFWSEPTVGNIKIGLKPQIILCPAVVGSHRASGCMVYDTNSNEIISIAI